MSWTDFFEFIKEDLKHHGGKSFYQKIRVVLLDERFQLLFNYRLSALLEDSKIPFFPVIIKIILKYLNLIVFSSIISSHAKIGKRCKFNHPIGIVIGRAVIGDDVNIFQQVTVGSKGAENQKMAFPKIGNNVIIYAHSVLLGDIMVRDNVIIAANSVVMKNLEKDGVYAGSPTKKIK